VRSLVLSDEWHTLETTTHLVTPADAGVQQNIQLDSGVRRNDKKWVCSDFL
jgi:hypothetical protein